ncbi:MAG TPA: aminotransferase class V-fold PLP-dependent enzyme [Thermomicrobiales bacterium]|nr:aminotransferase class V-fold PLP-dependent enzyme [Thermomicrobiales bacterium]
MKPEGMPQDWLRELGLRPVINAAATLTSLGGSIMPPEVVEAMAVGARHFVDYRDLQASVGARIAALTNNEAAYVSSGAAAGITLSIAACMAGKDPDLIRSFPGPDAFQRNEVLVYRSQRNGYDYAASMTGAKMIEVASEGDPLAARINEHTAAVLWFAGTRLRSDTPPIEEIIAIAHEVNVPVIVDAAAQIPPASNLWHFTRELGADVVIFSGGKGLRGPQATGLVMGRAALIEAVAANASPHYSIGRPMKVGKEELFGILAAVEWTLAQDEGAVIYAYEETVKCWIDGLEGLPGVEISRGFPSEAGQPHARAIVRVLPSARRDRDAVHDALWDMNPRIAVLKEGDDVLALNPQTLEPGEAEIVLDALRSVLELPPG